MVTQAITKRVLQAVTVVAGQFNGSDLRARCARGGMTLGIGVGLERGLQLFRYAILTRLLAPDEFGLMAVVLAATVLFETAFEVGVRYSVIQNKKGAEAAYLNVAWWFQVIRGLILFAVAYIGAPLVSRFYGQSELLVLLRVTILVVIFKSLVSPRAYVLEKRIKFGKVVILTQGSALLGTFLTIGLAFLLRNIWALVIGFVSEAFFYFLLSFILCPFRPRLSIDRESLGEIIRFAKGMLGLSVLAMVAFEIDILVLGKLVPMAVVGLYLMAKRLALAPKEVHVRIFGPLLLSAFSEKQDDRKRLRSYVLRLTRTVGVFGLPFTAFFVVCGGAILSVVFGSQYADAAVPFGFLSICTLVRIQGITLASIYLSLGQPHLHRGFVLFRVIILVFLIYPSIVFFGAAGAAGIVLFAEVSALFLQVVWMRKRIGLALPEYLSCWLAGLGLSQIVLIPVLVLRLFAPVSKFFDLAMGGGLCLLSCGIGMLVLKGGVKRVEPAVEVLREVKEDFEVRAKYA